MVRPALLTLLLLNCSWLCTNAHAINDSYTRHLSLNEIKEITIDEKPYLLLVRSWQGKKKRGAAIILPATNDTADSPGIMAFLRRNINHAGWASLSLTPPEDLPTPNFATDAAEIKAAGTRQLSTASHKKSPKIPSEQSSQHKQVQESFLIQGINQLNEASNPYPGKRILISADKSAGLLIDLLINQKIPLPDVFVVINPYWENEERNQKVAEQLAKLTIPVLDIQSPNGHPASLETVDNRKNLAITLGSPNYRQTLLILDLANESAWQNCLMAIKGFAVKMTQ